MLGYILKNKEIKLTEISVEKLVEAVGPEGEEFWPWPSQNIVAIMRNEVPQSNTDEWNAAGCTFYGPVVLLHGDLAKNYYESLTQEELDFLNNRIIYTYGSI